MSTDKEQIERRALSIKEAARACNLSRATAYRLIAAGRLATIKIGSRRLVRPEALDALLAKGDAAKCEVDPIRGTIGRRN
jgi:excisionase family DNA binding protein